MNIKAFLARIPQLIATIEGGLVLTGTKNERVSKYLELTSQLSELIAGMFALATAKGEVLPGAAVAGQPIPVVSSAPADAEADALETLRTLAGHSDIKRFLSGEVEGEPQVSFMLPDFAGLRFLPVAEFGIRALLDLAKQLNERKKRSDTGKAKSKPEPVKPKGKGKGNRKSK